MLRGGEAADAARAEGASAADRTAAANGNVRGMRRL